MIEAAKGEQTKEVKLDISKAKPDNLDKKEKEEAAPVPELAVTPRDWNVEQNSESRTTRVRPLHQNLVQSIIVERDQQASMIEGVKSKSFAQLGDVVSQSQSLQARRTMRQQKMVSPLMASNS